MTTTHTPTPWKVNLGPKPARVPWRGYRIETLADNIGPLWQGNGDARELANVEHAVACVNAHDALLARVAELEEALRKIDRAWCAPGMVLGYDVDIAAGMAEIARAALARSPRATQAR
jgi:hypothetical protein